MKLRNPFRRDQRVNLGAFPGNVLTGLGYTEDRNQSDPAVVASWHHPKTPTEIAVFTDGWVMAIGDDFDHHGFDRQVWDALAEVRPEAASMLCRAEPGAKCTAELEDH